MGFTQFVAAGLVAVSTVSGNRAGFKCSNDICNNNFKTSDGVLGTSFLTPKGNDASGATAVITGPGVYIMRDMDVNCDCKIEVLGEVLSCKNKQDVDKGIVIPDGAHTIKFVGNAANGCFKSLGEVTPPVDEVIKAMEAASEGSGLSSPNSILASGSGPGAQAVHEKPERFNGLDESVCDRMTHGVQMLILQEIPENTHSREIQLFMSHMSNIFDDFKAGLSYFGGEGGCFTDTVPLGNFPDDVKTDFTNAMQKAATSKLDTPEGSPMFALQQAANTVDWASPSNGKEVLRVILVDASGPPQAPDGPCANADFKEVAKALKSKHISVVFFVKPETKAAYEALQKEHHIAGYVHVLKGGASSMNSINALSARVKASLAKLCGKGQRLMLL